MECSQERKKKKPTKSKLLDHYALSYLRTLLPRYIAICLARCEVTYEYIYIMNDVYKLLIEFIPSR